MFKAVSVMLFFVFILSGYVGYRQIQASKFYGYTAVMERQGKWDYMMLYASRAVEYNPHDDKYRHHISRGLIIFGQPRIAIELMKQSLKQWPYKKYLINNMEKAETILKRKEANAKARP